MGDIGAVVGDVDNVVLAPKLLVWTNRCGCAMVGFDCDGCIFCQGI